MTFKWVCVNVMEKVPEELTEGYALPNYMRVVAEPKPYNATIVGRGGCFRDGNYSWITDGTFSITDPATTWFTSLLFD